MTNSSRSFLLDSNLIVVKIGSSSLVGASGDLNSQKFKKISEEIAFITKETGKKAILVSSGAIAAGAMRLKKENMLKTIEEKQAAAAIGQNLLMREYENNLSSFGLTSAQVLLTKDALEDRQRYINARNTIDQILKFGAVPIINENDTISADEIKFGDNDMLSALVAGLVGADLLIILSDVDGFLKDGKVVHTIEKISKEIEDNAGRSDSRFGTGGMLSKIGAAKIAVSSGIPVVIAKSSENNIISRIINGEEVGTLIVPKISKIEGKKRWLLGGKKVSGKIIVDDGAQKAIEDGGKSLLAVGITDVNGEFLQGDVVSIMNGSKKEIGRGVTNYSDKELLKIKGKRTAEAEKIIGVLQSDEVIHRDNMVIM